MQAMIVKRLTEPPPSVRGPRPAVAEAVDQAIRKALAPLAADRFGTIAQFALALLGSVSPVQTVAATVGTPATPVSTVPARVAAAAEPRRPRVSPVAVALVAGLLIGGGLLFAWRRSGAGGEPAGGRRIIAVLPFDNLGDSADSYFADGVSDEVRTKLGQVAGLEVIARGSSLEYRRTTKRPAEIAHELGADYLLTGTVRWEKSGGTNRVRVTPELVDARPGQAAHSKWGQQFDASLTDVFQVQGDIATKVADALGVALADSVRHELTAKPTDNLAAYDEYLKGEAASQAMASSDLPSLRRAIANYEHAVALDSTFAVAWARLSRARAAVFFNGIPSPELGVEARAAADRAIALQPNLADAYVALGDYYSEVTPIDNERALTEYKQGLRLNPDNTDLLGNIALTEWTLGRWDSVAYRLSRAVALDPRSVNTARRLAFTYLFQRNYKAADSAIDRAFALSPASPRLALIKAMIQVAQGNLAAARAVVGTAAAQIDPEIVLPFFANYQDFYWLLDEDQQRRVLTMAPSAFDNDRGIWAVVHAELYHLRGDRARVAAYADSARLALEEQIRTNPDDGQRHAILGVALGYLGRKSDAVREGQRAVQLMPISRDAYNGEYIQLQLARTYILVGDADAALDQLEPLLKMPCYISPGWLRLDPAFDPLRQNPRFQKLVASS
jgi:serine/threonine-protein kinase